MASNTVFVSNFPFTTTEETLRDVFSGYCEVRGVRIIVDRETGRSRGFAFVEVANPDTIDAAIEALDGSEFGGRRLSVSRARGRTGLPEGAPARRGAAPRSGDAGSIASGSRGRSEGGAGDPGPPFRHRIVLDWSDEDHAYTATVPSLGVAGSGATLDAAVRDAVARGRAAAEELVADGDESAAGGGFA